MKHVELIVDKKRLKGALVFPKKLKEKNPAVLFIHGWTSEKERSYQYANSLAKLGYISFLFDMRGHGESEGDIHTATTKEFLDDVIAAYDYFVTVKGVDRENMSVVGSSFGGCLGAILTAKRNVKRLALRVPADYPNDAFHKPKMQTIKRENSAILTWRMQTRSPSETFALEAVAHFNGEILIIESGKDDVVPHETIQNYANAVKDRRKLTHVVMKNAPHSIKEGPFRDKVEKILVNWFKKSYKD